MFIIDSISPLTQKILEIKLVDYIGTKNSYRYIITDRENLNGDNIIKIGSDITFPFSIKQIESYLKEPKKRDKIESIKNIDLIRDKILSIVTENNSKIEKEIEELLEKR